MITDIKSYSHFVFKNTKVGSMLLNPLDEYISKELIDKKTWEDYLYPVFNEYIKDGDCVVDMGANIGAHTLFFSKSVGVNGCVKAFEPLKELYLQLNYNCITNRCKNVTTYNYGLSNTSKEMKGNILNLQQKHNFGGYSLLSNKKVNEYQTVITKSLDYFNFKPNFLKIDVECMEDLVLLGSQQTILKYKPVILVEIHPPEFHKVNKIMTDVLNYKLINKYGPSSWDCLYLPK